MILAPIAHAALHDANCFRWQTYRDPLDPKVMDILADFVRVVIANRSGFQLSRRQRRVLQSILRCRRPGMGSHSWKCRWCGNELFLYNACSNRHCPSCRQERRVEWVDRILSWALPIDYLHCVFTLPHEFNPLILAGDEVFYRLIFASASATLSAIARKKFGCRVGIVMVLHTWGQAMKLHVHVHIIVTCGGLSLDKMSWVPFPPEALEPNGDFSREVLAEHFRHVFLQGVRRLFRQRELTMPSSMADVTTASDMETWLAPVLRKRWCVDVQSAPPGYNGPKAVLNYLAGYVVGTAIHDRRILRYDGRCVVIAAKDYRTGKTEELSMTGEEFVRRFATHILPDRFRRIRYAGMFCARYREGYLARCHELLGTTDELDDSAAPAETCLTPEPPAEERQISEPRPGPPCGHCGMDGMISQGNRPAEQTEMVVARLCAFFNRIFTWLTTMDIDRSTRSVRTASYICVTEVVVISCDSTWQSLDTASFDTHSLRIPDT